MLFNSHQFRKTGKTVNYNSCESLDFDFFDDFL